MTTAASASRFIMRGGNSKACIFFYIVAVVLVIGAIAFYNNTVTQLEHARKANELCHQQEENLSTQLQVISEYKQRLESSLKSEKSEHTRSRTEIEARLNEERRKGQKLTNEANLKYSSLQQHFNLLQTQIGDLKENCSSTQQSQLSEIKSLQGRFSDVQQALKKLKLAQENLNAQYAQLERENERAHTETSELRRKIQTYQQKCVLEEENVGRVPPVASSTRGKFVQGILRAPANTSTSKATLNTVPPVKMPDINSVGYTTTKQQQNPDDVNYVNILPVPHIGNGVGVVQPPPQPPPLPPNNRYVDKMFAKDVETGKARNSAEQHSANNNVANLPVPEPAAAVNAAAGAVPIDYMSIDEVKENVLDHDRY